MNAAHEEICGFYHPEGALKINREFVFTQDSQEYKSCLRRLKSTLEKRLHLFNHFKSRVVRGWEPITVENLKIKMDVEGISSWLWKNGDELDLLKNHFINHGSRWQKRRCEEIFVNPCKDEADG